VLLVTLAVAAGLVLAADSGDDGRGPDPSRSGQTLATVSPSPVGPPPTGDVGIVLDTGPGRSCEVTRVSSDPNSLAPLYVTVPLRLEWTAADGRAAAPPGVSMELDARHLRAPGNRTLGWRTYQFDGNLRPRSDPGDSTDRSGDGFYRTSLGPHVLGTRIRLPVHLYIPSTVRDTDDSNNRITVTMDLPLQVNGTTPTITCSVSTTS
jgi:hypothetical protein